MQCCPKQNPGFLPKYQFKKFPISCILCPTPVSFDRSFCMDLNCVNCSFCRFSPQIHSTKHYAVAASTVSKISYVFPHKHLPNTGWPSRDLATTLGHSWRGFVLNSHQSNQLVENWESQVKSRICKTEIVKDNKYLLGFICRVALWFSLYLKSKALGGFSHKAFELYTLILYERLKVLRGKASIYSVPEQLP